MYWGIFTNHSNHLRIENNEVYGSKRQHGIYVSNSGDWPVVRGNTVYDNAASGIQLNGDKQHKGDGIISRALIENNIIYDNGVKGGAALNLDGVQHSVLQNNLLYDNHATGIALFKADGGAGPKGIEVKYNTLVMANDARWVMEIHNSKYAIHIQNNVLVNPNPKTGIISFGDKSDVQNTRSDYNILGEIPVFSHDERVTQTSFATWQYIYPEQEVHSIEVNGIDNIFVDTIVDDYQLQRHLPFLDAGYKANHNLSSMQLQ